MKQELAEKGALDVGTGAERELGVSSGVLQEALFILETEGYNRFGVGVPQVNNPKNRTITPVISVPDIDQRQVYQDLALVKSVGEYHSTDGGESWDKREYPASIGSDRVKIRYVNNKNLLDYYYIKYDVDSGKKLEKLYHQYLEEKEQRKQFAETEARREYYHKQLLAQLGRYRIRYPDQLSGTTGSRWSAVTS